MLWVGARIVAPWWLGVVAVSGREHPGGAAVQAGGVDGAQAISGKAVESAAVGALAKRESSAVDSTALRVWMPLVLGLVRARYQSNAQTARKLVELIERCCSFLEAHGKEHLHDLDGETLAVWVWAPSRDHRTGRLRAVAPPTARNRRWAVSVMLAAMSDLGAPVKITDLGGLSITAAEVEPRTLLLDDVQMRQLETHANPGVLVSRRPLMVALSRAGGAAPEIATVATADLDLNEGAVTLCGRNGLRVNPLDEWSLAAVRRFLHIRPPATLTEPLCVGPGMPADRAVHVVSVRLRGALRDAGLGGIRGITPSSIRLTAAQAVLDRAGLEAAARFLGAASLDRTAASLGYDWASRDGC